MIVCSCNVLTDRQIVECIQGAAGIASVFEVYTRLGCQPQCGQCARTIACILQSSIGAQERLQAEAVEIENESINDQGW